MIHTLIPLLTALLLSGIAAFYSIIGLFQIFPGAKLPILLMGGALELAKLVTAAWLYRNWSRTPFLLKTYFLAAVTILMLITSMGIFGFLAKSHLQTATTVAATTLQRTTLDSQESILKSRLDYLLKRAGDPSTASSRIDRDIQRTSKQLEDLTTKKLPLLTSENILLADLGPIRYVAEFIYGSNDPATIDRAVRVVIVMIIIVFDPLAILLLIAANMGFVRPSDPMPTTASLKAQRQKLNQLASRLKRGEQVIQKKRIYRYR